MSSVSPSRTPIAAAARGLTRLILSIGGLQPADAGKALPLGFAYAAILASLYVLKPARNALFLSRIGPADLPLVMCAVAVVGGLTALALARAADSLRVERLMRWLLPALSASLIAWWYWLSHAPALWQVASFYVWVNLYGQLTTALLWLLAGAAVDARESRRVFAFVGALGIAGAVCGGALTQQAATTFGTVNLLPLCALALMVAWLLVARLSPSDAPRPGRAAVGSDKLSDVRDSPLLRVLLLMTLLGAVATSVIDFQFNAIVNANLPSEDEKTAFFGSFFAYLNAGAFVFQLAFTSRVMSRFGLGTSLLVLPTALGIGGVLAVIAPGLAAATFLKASDASLRHSLYRSAVELLFIPVPARIKSWFRVFLDATVDNIGTGIGALSVLALTASVGMNYRHLAVLSVCVIGLWGAVAASARAAHVEAFRNALETRQIHPDELVVDAAQGSVVGTLQSALDATSERQLVYVLDLVRAAPSASYRPRLIELASHSSAEVRAGALAALAQRPRAPLEFDVRPWLFDADGRVRREAAMLLVRADREGEPTALRALLAHPDVRVQIAALGAAIDLSLTHLVDLDQSSALLAMKGDAGELARRELARAVAFLPPSPERHRLLSVLAEDGSVEVARQAIQSAGLLGDPELVELLIARAREHTVRAQAIEALARHGANIVPRLVAELSASDSMAVKFSVARVLARIDHQSAVDALLAALPSGRGGLRHALLSSLNKQKARATGLSFDSAVIDAELAREVEQSRFLSSAISVYGAPSSPPGRLLARTLEEKRKESLEHVFRLLGLRYIPKDIEVAFIAVTSNHARARAQAIEFLDNYLNTEDRRQVLSLLETPASSARESGARRESVLAELIHNRDAWLRACAIYFAAGQSEHLAAVRAALSDPELVVRETAGLVLSREDVAC